MRVGKVGARPVQEDRGEEEQRERLLEVGPGEGRREGRGQKTAVAKLGGGELWTVNARGDRCPGPSPSGYVELRELKETLVSLCPLLGAVRILFTLYQAGALRGWARRHPPSS